MNIVYASKWFQNMKLLQTSIRRKQIYQLHMERHRFRSWCVCGYILGLTAHSTSLKLKYLGYVEIFQRAVDGSLLNDELFFARSGDIKDPLLKQLWFIKGCTTSTIEVMMKHYQSTDQSNAYRLNKFTRAVDFVLLRECIVRQYETFKETFPITHCMFQLWCCRKGIAYGINVSR